MENLFDQAQEGEIEDNSMQRSHRKFGTMHHIM